MSYDLYSQTLAIAAAIVRKSKGLGMHHFDAFQIKADADRAESVAQVAREYWAVMHEHHATVQRVKAAKTLSLDETDYQREADDLKAQMDAYIVQMETIVSGWYHSPSNGWVEK